MKKTCEGMEDRIILLLDGELSEKETAETRKHIDSCSECAKLYAEYQALDKKARGFLLTGTPLPEVNFAENTVIGKLFDPIASFFRKLSGAKLAPVAMGAALILLALLTMTYFIETRVPSGNIPDSATIVVAGNLTGTGLFAGPSPEAVVPFKGGEIPENTFVKTSNSEATFSTDRYNLTIKAGTLACLSGSTLDIKNGSVFIDYFKKPGNYIITTPNARVEIVGTQLSVSHSQEKTLVEVFEGKVKVAGKNGDIYLVAGEKAVVEKPFEPSKIEHKTSVSRTGPVLVSPAETRTIISTSSEKGKEESENNIVEEETKNIKTSLITESNETRLDVEVGEAEDSREQEIINLIFNK